TPLTIRLLQTHTAGTWSHRGDYVSDLEHRLAEYYPHLRVAQNVEYNGMSLALTGKILEELDGQALPLLYKKYLFDPMGCGQTEATNASHGSKSTALDLARIGQMVVNHGAYGDMRYFKPETYDKMLPQRLTAILGRSTTAV